MWLIDNLIKRTSASTPGTMRMKPIVGPTKFAPAKTRPRNDRAAVEALEGLEIVSNTDSGADPYNAHCDRYEWTSRAR